MGPCQEKGRPVDIDMAARGPVGTVELIVKEQR